MAGRGIDEKLRCSFCNKTQDQVKKLICRSERNLHL